MHYGSSDSHPLVKSASHSNLLNPIDSESTLDVTTRSTDFVPPLGPNSASQAIESENQIEDGKPSEEEDRPPFDERDVRVQELQSAYRATLRDLELATALAGRPLVKGAVNQLIRLWRDDLDVYEQTGNLKVSARDGRAVEDWVSEKLQQAEYSHFCVPLSRGGASPKGASQSGVANRTRPAIRTLGEAVISEWKESMSNQERGTRHGHWGRQR